MLRALPGLGDMLCAVPALWALREGLPDAHIALLGMPWTRSFVDRFRHYVDELIAFPGFPGLTPAVDVAAVPGFLAGIQARRFELALQMHGSGVLSNPVVELLGARATAGFYVPGHYRPSEHFIPYPEHEPEVRRNLLLVESLGVSSAGEHLAFPILDEDVTALGATREACGLVPGEYICLHPGATDPARRWPASRFARVADALASRGFRVVLTGSGAERALVEDVARAMDAPSTNLAGKTSIGALAALLRDARLLICNDTGVSHLAAAMETPSVVIFLASDPARWAPLDRDTHRVVGRPVRQADGSFAGSFPPDSEVTAEAEDLLQKEGVNAA